MCAVRGFSSFAAWYSLDWKIKKSFVFLPENNKSTVVGIKYWSRVEWEFFCSELKLKDVPSSGAVKNRIGEDKLYFSRCMQNRAANITCPFSHTVKTPWHERGDTDSSRDETELDQTASVPLRSHHIHASRREWATTVTGTLCVSVTLKL